MLLSPILLYIDGAAHTHSGLPSVIKYRIINRSFLLYLLLGIKTYLRVSYMVKDLLIFRISCSHSWVLEFVLLDILCYCFS